MFSSLARRRGTARRVTLRVESLDGRILPGGGAGINPSKSVDVAVVGTSDVYLMGSGAGVNPSKSVDGVYLTGSQSSGIDFRGVSLTGNPAGGIPSKIATSPGSVDDVDLMGSAGGAIPPIVR
jgi:hypothetical protein